MALQTKLRFNRYEFKYVLNPNLRREIERELNFFMELDPYVAGNPQRRYFVRSLYYDNPMYTHYFDKIDGQLTRTKFRLRTYTDNREEGCSAFLEIKGRQNNIVFKHRSPLVADHGANPVISLSEPITETILRFTREGEVLERFRFDIVRRAIVPVMLIDYWRRPYVSKLDPEFRVTFDERLNGRRTDSLFPGPSVPWRSLMLGRTIMEVKFRFHVPSWFHRILQSYELARVSVSKICKGIEAFELAPALE